MLKPQFPQLTPDSDFTVWSEINEIELSCIFAESGADRELDFDRERLEEELFENDPRTPPL